MSKPLDTYLCMDVDYRDTYAITAGILFKDIKSEETLKETVVKVEEVQPYQSGQFYKRELPCLTKLIDSLEELPSVFIVDSYVLLDSHGTPGLGAYLYEHYNKVVPVIGVAKNNFKDNQVASEVLRGESKTPLYVTSLGINQKEAAKLIKSMHGNYRFPTLLKKVDQNCRTA